MPRKPPRELNADFVKTVVDEGTYSDAAIPGFRLRVREGRKIYQFRYGTGQRGRYQWMTIGEHGTPWRPDLKTGVVRPLTAALARGEAFRLRGIVEGGGDPAREARREKAATESGTFEAMARRLIARADLGDRTRQQWLWLLGKHVFPKYGKTAPAAIRRADVRELLFDKKDRPIRGANDVLKVLKWVCSRACDEELLEYNPAAAVRRPVKLRPRGRVLSPGEIRAVWVAAGAQGAYGCRVRLALLTAARRGPLTTMRKAEIEGPEQERVWRIPASKAKNQIAYDVPLVAAAVKELDRAAQLAGAAAVKLPWVFPGDLPLGEKEWGPLASTSRAWRKLLVAAEVIPAPAAAVATDHNGHGAKKTKMLPPASKPERRPWTAMPIRFHDLRRTVRDILTRELGVAVPIAEAILGHAAPKIVATYAPGGIPLRDKRRALERWERKLLAIVEAKPAGNVVAGTFGT